MANLSKIMLPDGTSYDICDTTARSKFMGGNIWFATCATAAGTAAKVATTTTGDFALATGSVVLVKFTNAFTYNGTSTLNVDSKGAKSITRVGTTTTTRYYVSAGEVIEFVYDGTYFVMARTGTATTTYYGLTKLSTSATSTSTALALTPASLNSYSMYTVTGLPVYSTTATYAVGDRVRYGNYMYECNTAITTAEAWTASHWTMLDPLLTQIDAKSTVSIDRKTTSGTNICDITIDGTTTSIYAPNGGGTQVQSDWDETDTTSPAYIQNKPTIPTLMSELTNDEGYYNDNSNLSIALTEHTDADTYVMTLDGVNVTIPNTNSVSIFLGLSSAMKTLFYYMTPVGEVHVFEIAKAQILGMSGGFPTALTYQLKCITTGLEETIELADDPNANQMVGTLYYTSTTIPTSTSQLTNDSGFVSANDVYPVGSVYITSTNTAPTVGGTWTLIDKEFTPYVSTTSAFTINSTNTTSVANYLLIRKGHEVILRLQIKNKVALAATNLALGTITSATFGISSGYADWDVHGTSDGGTGLCMASMTESSGTWTLTSVCAITRTSGGSIAAGSNIEFMFRPVFDMEKMLDSACNKFYWKRTA